jgi:hypothetical protein
MSPNVPISSLRLALRAANGFTVDWLKLGVGERDFTDVLILTVIVQSNSASLAGDPALQLRYAVFAAHVPGDIRRAISINAIAVSLGLPFETVRRRIKKLIAEGVCEATAQGVRLTDELLTSPAHGRALEAVNEGVRGLYLRLVRARCIELMDLPPYAPAALAGGPPVRIVWRAAAGYVLRMMEFLVPNFPSLTRAFVTMEVLRANTEGLSDAVRGEDGLGAEAMVPDELRRPVRASEVAANLGLPHETTRRNLAALAEDGRCRRVRDGYIVPAETLARPNMIAAWGANFRNLSRMFADLAETGVLARWDAEVETAGAEPRPMAP